MALIACRYCGESVAENAWRCPHCGGAWPKRGANRESVDMALLGVGLPALGCLGMLAFFWIAC